MRLRQVALAFLVAAPLLLTACSEKEEQCGACTKDSDCKDGLVCDTFTDAFGRILGQACDDGRGRTCVFTNTSASAK